MGSPTVVPQGGRPAARRLRPSKRPVDSVTYSQKGGYQGVSVDKQRRLVDLGWGQVSYLEWLPDCEPKAEVLLLHGGGVDCAELSWGGVGPALAGAGYRVIAPDHPGYGESALASWTATQERLVCYVGEFVDRLGLRDYVIGGLSLAGGMTIGHLLGQPPRVRGAILLGSYGLMDHQLEGPFKRPAHLLTWVLLRTGVLRRLTDSYARDRKKMASALRAIVRNPEARTAELLDAVMVEAQRVDAAVAFEQWQFDQFGWAKTRTNYSDQLRSITIPVLVIHGDHDTGVPVNRARDAARKLPDARLLVVPDAGHWVQRDRPAVVLRAVLDFLAELV